MPAAHPAPHPMYPCPRSPPGDSQQSIPSWRSRELPGLLTLVAVVVYQDDLLKQGCRGVVDGAVHRAQDHRQRLVHKDEDDGDLGQVLPVFQLFAPAAPRAERDKGSAEVTGQRFQPGTGKIHRANPGLPPPSCARPGIPTVCKSILQSLLLGRENSRAEHPQAQRAHPNLCVWANKQKWPPEHSKCL